jgi:hypothetical protein
MFKQKLEKVIEEIQSKNVGMTKFPSLLEVCEPGETNFVPRSIGESGFLLLCPFKIDSRKTIIQTTEQNPTDFMGVSPFMMVVMESSSKQFAPGDVVLVDPKAYRIVDENFILIKAAVAYLLPDNMILGVDKNITNAAREKKEIIKTLADA